VAAPCRLPGGEQVFVDVLVLGAFFVRFFDQGERFGDVRFGVDRHGEIVSQPPAESDRAFLRLREFDRRCHCGLGIIEVKVGVAVERDVLTRRTVLGVGYDNFPKEKSPRANGDYAHGRLLSVGCENNRNRSLSSL